MKQIIYTFTDEHFATFADAVCRVRPIPKEKGVPTMTQLEWIKHLGINNKMQRLATKGIERQKKDDDPIDNALIDNIISEL